MASILLRLGPPAISIVAEDGFSMIIRLGEQTDS
jgi:hypothetical protein